MTFGPQELTAYMRRKGKRVRESAAVQAAREAAATPLSDENILTVISGPSELVRIAPGTLEAARVYEAVAMPPEEAGAPRAIRVCVRNGAKSLVLVLSSHHAVDWQIELERGAGLEAVLLAGAGDSTVSGAGEVPIVSIGGFYAFKPGSLEFRHLEDEVMRCTRRSIDGFQSDCASNLFVVGAG